MIDCRKSSCKLAASYSFSPRTDLESADRFEVRRSPTNICQVERGHKVESCPLHKSAESTRLRFCPPSGGRPATISDENNLVPAMASIHKCSRRTLSCAVDNFLSIPHWTSTWRMKALDGQLTRQTVVLHGLIRSPPDSDEHLPNRSRTQS